MLNKSLLMRRAWSLLRQSMAPYKHDGAGFALKRNGVEFGRLTGPAGALTFTTTDAALAERAHTAFASWEALPAALAKVRAADEALRLSRIA